MYYEWFGYTHIELNNPQRIIPIIMLPQIRLHSRNPNSSNTLHLTLLPEEPQRKVDIVNGTVDEDPARELGVRDEEPGRIELVACLAAEDGGCAYVAAGQAGVGVAVGGVEAAGEAADDFLGGIFLDGGFVGVHDGLGLVVIVSSEFVPWDCDVYGGKMGGSLQSQDWY